MLESSWQFYEDYKPAIEVRCPFCKKVGKLGLSFGCDPSRGVVQCMNCWEIFDREKVIEVTDRDKISLEDFFI